MEPSKTVTSTVTLWQTPNITLKRVASTNGGEFSSACPECGGRDRFRVWPNEGETGRFWCRRCDKKGDLIDFLQWQKGLSFKEAAKIAGKDLTKKIRRVQTDMSWSRPKQLARPKNLVADPEPIKHLIPGVDYFPMETWELTLLNQQPSPICLSCESQSQGWCLVHPRNQFVNIRFIDACPKDFGSCALCELNASCEREPYSWISYSDRCQGFRPGRDF